MTEMTDDQVNRVLAKFMGWTRLGGQWNSPWGINNNGYYIRKAEYDWSPPTNRNDLAEVLAKLTPEQWYKVNRSLPTIHSVRSDTSPRHGFSWWLLTCDPAIIARAVAEVVGK